MGKLETRLANIVTTGDVTGSGTSGQVALWSGTSTLTGDDGLTYGSGALTILAPDADHGVLILKSSTTTGTVRQYFRNSDSTRAFEFDGDFTAASEILLLQSDSVTICQWTRTGKLQMNHDGTAVLPAIAFASSTGLGIWRAGANDMRISAAGAAVLGIAATTVTVYSTSNVLWDTDGGGDIGASGANRPNRIYVKTTGTFGGDVTLSGTATTFTLREMTLVRNSATDFRWYISGSEVFAVFPSNNRMLIQGGTTVGAAIDGAGLSFFSSGGGTGLAWVSNYNGNGVSTLVFSGNSGTVGMYMTSALVGIRLKIVYTATAATAGSDSLTFTNGPAGTAGNPDKYFIFNDGSNDFAIPGFQL